MHVQTNLYIETILTTRLNQDLTKSSDNTMLTVLGENNAYNSYRFLPHILIILTGHLLLTIRPDH